MSVGNGQTIFVADSKMEDLPFIAIDLILVSFVEVYPINILYPESDLYLLFLQLLFVYPIMNAEIFTSLSF